MSILVEDSDCQNSAQEEVETLLADYSGTAFFPSGVELSVEQQLCLHSLFDEDICKGHYRKNVHVHTSTEDKAVFEQLGFKGADTYGEMLPESFLEVLWKLGAKPGERFYDLGSGTGKLAALAWVAGLTATGIELSRARSQVAWQTLARLESTFGENSEFSGKWRFPAIKAGGLKYICGNIFDIDFLDADIVFFSSVTFSKCLVTRMANIARWMKPGSRIVSFHDLAELASFPEFKLLGVMYVTCTWFVGSCWFVHEVISNPSEDEWIRPVFGRSESSLTERTL